MSSASFDIANERSDLNQYWYSPASIEKLVAEVKHHATRCAFLSCPSLYFALPADDALRQQSHVFEFDRQWAGDRGFVFYDYHKPLQVPIQLCDSFDYVVVDPPFITREVWSQYLETVQMLLKKGGKVLFTSVLENHGMHSQGLDQGLYVPLYRPSIPHLTYQYHCFTNYIATQLQVQNPELEPEDAKTRSALRMANDLRESEKEFTAQMQNRSREGETPLPALARANADGTSDGGRVMKWTHIPEGLTMYKDGAEAPPPEEQEIDYGPEYKSAVERRALCDAFKRGVDQSQRFLDALLKLQGKSNAEVEVAKVETERLQLLDSMEALSATLLADPYKSTPDELLIPVMKECVAAYRAVKIERQLLQELAADATRKYKSPVFQRQKELLAEMKILKKNAANAAAAA
ncbi:methyltransferase, putative [Bodo saltans]|uniref:Methyltransferase, putative n=1 Tax=Bodo saltans TaxID=75058 RepID=A0A0S4KEA9_BODSA|nr:methyltransferase, putative [Bodo saltans]|eukprot:CUI12950.1 methyltransferase, putative [Bodo saltans]